MHTRSPNAPPASSQQGGSGCGSAHPQKAARGSAGTRRPTHWTLPLYIYIYIYIFHINTKPPTRVPRPPAPCSTYLRGAGGVVAVPPARAQLSPARLDPSFPAPLRERSSGVALAIGPRMAGEPCPAPPAAPAGCPRARSFSPGGISPGERQAGEGDGLAGCWLTVGSRCQQ